MRRLSLAVMLVLVAVVGLAFPAGASTGHKWLVKHKHAVSELATGLTRSSVDLGKLVKHPDKTTFAHALAACTVLNTYNATVTKWEPPTAKSRAALTKLTNAVESFTNSCITALTPQTATAVQGDLAQLATDESTLTPDFKQFLKSLSTARPSASRKKVTTTTAPQGATAGAEPIAVQPDTSSNTGGTATILVPTSCTIAGSTATASGTYRSTGTDSSGTPFAPESYVRFGDVVGLYVYSSSGTQIAKVTTESGYRLGTSPPWHVSVPLDLTLGEPSHCDVTVQGTHAFQGAGSAGG